jgi:hypothetical protein
MKYLLAIIFSISVSTAHAGFFDSISDVFSKTGIFHKRGNGRNRLPIYEMYNIPPDATIDPPDNGVPGDVPPDDMPAVPVPASVWLFLSGLVGLIGVARRKHG